MGSYVLRPTPIDASGGEVVSPDGTARAIISSGSVYEEFLAQVTRDSAVVTDPIGVEPVSHVYRFEPSSVPFREMVSIHFSIPEGTEAPEKLGIYEWTDKGWTFVWNDVDLERGTVWAGVWYLADVAQAAGRC